MDYRSAWLNHTGSITRHHEVVLHALDRDLPDGPVRMLLVGLDNGGALEIWPTVLPSGSTVVSVDENLGPNVGCVTDREWMLSVLGSQEFDVIIDRTGDAGESTWPWLASGGKLFLEGADPEDVALLAVDVAYDRPSWLPVEEILRVTVFPHVAVVEKRLPRVLPYLEVMTGNFADVVPEEELLARGVRRVLVD